MQTAVSCVRSWTVEAINPKTPSIARSSAMTAKLGRQFESGCRLQWNQTLRQGRNAGRPAGKQELSKRRDFARRIG